MGQTRTIEPVDVAGEQVDERPRAICWQTGTVRAWVAKSQVTIVDARTLRLPRWLAEKVGFV